MPRKKKGKVGHPTVLTEKALQLLKDAFLLGCSDREACFYAEISEGSLYNHQRRNPEYIKQKELWKENPILKARKKVVEDISQDSRLALDYLKCKRKEEFSTKLETASESVNVNVNSNFTGKELLDELKKRGLPTSFLEK